MEEVKTHNHSIVYKLRSRDGLFSKGGSWIGFNKKGKVWKRKSDLSSHLSHLSSEGVRRYRELGVEVIEYAVTEQELRSCSAMAYIEEVKDKKRLKEQQQRQRDADYERHQRRQQYEKLRKEFGNE